METLIKVFVLLCCFSGALLPIVSGLFPHASPAEAAAATAVPDEPLVDSVMPYYGSRLSLKLKALSEQSVGREARPRLRPESRYVRYMKRLYKISLKQGRRPDRSASHVYNTVRLIAPRDECLERSEESSMQDLSYSLDRVRAQEQLLKSILLYSLDKDQATSFASLCNLDVKEQEHAGQKLCSTMHHSVSFRVRSEKRSRRIWVEIDVTTFLHPIIRSQKKEIHLLINLTCAENGEEVGGSQERRVPMELFLRSPSLLLYLNDTSEVAYQRWPSSARSESLRPSLVMNNFLSLLKSKQKGPMHGRRRPSKRDAAVTSPVANPTAHSPRYDFPTDDCELYDFRVSFSQLKLDHWIIAPQKYNPRYCKGICPRAMQSIYGSPVHTIVQNIIYEQLDSSVPRPSCVPSEYKPLSVLIIESDGSIAYKEYEEMIATKCTCR
ncbi:growth differentiation factor 9-like [Scleropages formosus]|uniref:Growth differentiation factor 9 n=1 Tax=Scleropages formosus TaxID=113540 RepID=A0A0P7WWX6_SCLFO|nr:growth/differentiation factor 9 [Scleropages formosus]KPP68615.1 growth differentiation factor 9-like [Scleropages formosus]